MWGWIVERYSECKLTKPKDKLVAISGVARIIQRQTRDQYVAGLWRKDLEVQFCWGTETPDWQDRRVFPYKAPSWSWASLDCRVRLWGEKYPRLQRCEDIWIRVLDVQLTALDSDPLGQLSMAQLRLSCLYLANVGVKINKSGKGVLIIGGNSLTCRVSFDSLGEDENCNLQKVKAMPVFTHLGESKVEGLLLEPTGEQRGQYQRIGWFSFFAASLEDSKAFASNIVKPSCQVAEEECLKIQKDKDGKTQRVITLV